MSDETRELYNQLRNKRDFRLKVARRFEMSPTSVQNNWIYNQSIPEQYRDEFLQMLKEELKNQ